MWAHKSKHKFKLSKVLSPNLFLLDTSILNSNIQGQNLVSSTKQSQIVILNFLFD